MSCLFLVSARNTLGLCTKRLAEKYNALFSNSPVRTMSASEQVSGQAVTLAYRRYEAKSEGTPLLVIHGFCGSKRNWATFCKAYNELTGREIIAVDCRNHGQSEQREELSYPLMCYDVETTLAQLDISKAVVIGHSMGGKVAMNMALSMPNLVEKLVVVDVSPSPSFPEVTNLIRGSIQAMISLDLTQVKTRRDADKLLATSIPSPNARAFLLTSLVRHELGNFYWQLNLNGLQQNIEEIFKGVDLIGREKYEGETLFVVGGESDFVKAHNLPKIKTLFPKARREVVPGADHFIDADKPKELLQIIHRFLA